MQELKWSGFKSIWRLNIHLHPTCIHAMVERGGAVCTRMCVQLLMPVCLLTACSPDGAIRLVNGSTLMEGRVEYCTSGVWGTVSSNGFDSLSLQVVCTITHSSKIVHTLCPINSRKGVKAF